MKNNTRKILLAILVVMTLLVSMATITASAADGNTVYLETGSWNVDNARFAIYTWDGGEQWFDMTDNDGDGIYECTLPAGISNIIFVSFPATSDNIWDNKNAQTADLTLSAGDTYIIDNASGSGHWKSAGSGSGNSGSTNSGTYTVAGVAALCGSEWSTTDTYNDMTFNAETGLYEKLFTGVPAGYYECKVAADHAWANSWGGTAGEYGTNYAFEITEEKNITITFDPVSKVVSHVESASTGAQERPEPEAPDIDWEDTITIYVGDSSWSTTYVYCWTQGSNDQNAAWPGVEMEWDGEKMLYYYEVPKYYVNIIFNDGNGTQTEDMLIPGDGALYDVTTKTWTDIDKYVPPTPPANTTEDITVYVKDAAGWGNVFVYYWGAEGEEPGFAFPGLQMTKGEDGFYYATIPAGYWGITFSNGGDWQDGSLLQTPDLIIPTDGKTGINNTSKTNDWYAVAGNNNSGNNDNTNTPGGSTDGGNDNGDQPAKEMTFLQKLALKLLLFLRSIEDLFKGFFKK